MEIEEIRARLATIENLRRRDNDQVTHFELLAVLKEKTAIYEAVLEFLDREMRNSHSSGDLANWTEEALRAREVAE